MGIATNRISGRSVWGMTTDHHVMMLRAPPGIIDLEIIDLYLPGGGNIDLELPGGGNVELELVMR